MGLKTLKEIDVNGERVLEFVNGNFTFITGTKAVVQRLENRLRRFLGEFFDGVDGIDWLDIFNGALDTERVEVVIRAELLKDEFVENVISVDAELNRNSRVGKIDFTVKLIDGIEAGGSVPISGGV